MLSIRQTSASPWRSATPLHHVPSASSTHCVLAWNPSSKLLNFMRSVMRCEVAPQSTIRLLTFTPAAPLLTWKTYSLSWSAVSRETFLASSHSCHCFRLQVMYLCVLLLQWLHQSLRWQALARSPFMPHLKHTTSAAALSAQRSQQVICCCCSHFLCVLVAA